MALNKLLGKRVSFTAELRKRGWGQVRRNEVVNIKPQIGVICGKRIKRDGYWALDERDVRYFDTYTITPCYIVAVSMNQTVFVPCDKVEFLD